MTVQDLIGILQAYPPDLPVVYFALDSMAMGEETTAGYDKPIRVDRITVKAATQGSSEFQLSTEDPEAFEVVRIL